MSTLDAVKKLRFKTSAGMMECSAALKEAAGNIEKAIEILRKKGITKAAKKASRVAGQGVIETYIHTGGRIGVLLEVNCETDFVAKNEAFTKLTKDLAYVKRDDVPAEAIKKEKEIFRSQIKDKPANVVDKIVEGKLDKYFSEVCLLEQPYIKDPDKKISELLTQTIATLGENIVVKRFARYEVGEEI